MQAKVEIVVREGEVGETVVATVNQLAATTLVVGLHDKSFLYRYLYSNSNCNIKMIPQLNSTQLNSLEIY